VGNTVSDADAMDDLAEFLDDAYADIISRQCNETTYVDLDGYNVTGDNPMPETSWPTRTAGTAASEPLPTGSAGLITFRTGFSRRNGRKFLGVFSEGCVSSSGLWTTATQTALAAFGANFLSGFTGGTSGENWMPGVYSKLGTLMPIIEAVASGIPAYQRRRRIGTGS